MVLKLAGIEGATTGVDIYSLSKLLGHASVSITEKAYAQDDRSETPAKLGFGRHVAYPSSRFAPAPAAHAELLRKATKSKRTSLIPDVALSA